MSGAQYRTLKKYHPYSLKRAVETEKQTISQTDKMKSFQVESVSFCAYSAHLTHSG